MRLNIWRIPASFVRTDEETIGRCEVYRYLGDEMDNIYYEFWKKVK